MTYNEFMTWWIWEVTLRRPKGILLNGQQQLQQGINGGVRSCKISRKIRKWFKLSRGDASILLEARDEVNRSLSDCKSFFLFMWCSTNYQSARCVKLSWQKFGSINKESWIFGKGKVEDASKVNEFALAHACFENSCVRGPWFPHKVLKSLESILLARWFYMQWILSICF